MKNGLLVLGGFVVPRKLGKGWGCGNLRDIE